MKLVAYLAFTLLSIAIQFSLMDLIQGGMQVDDKDVDLNVTSPKKKLSDILKDYYNNKPHALYYRTTGKNSALNAKLLTEKLTTLAYTNTTDQILDLDSPLTSTLTVIELDDENEAITESAMTSEIPYTTSTDFENVTELSIFNSDNKTTTVKPPMPKGRVKQENCYCDLLYETCDVNCCCDADCSEETIKLFYCPKTIAKPSYEDYLCSSEDKSLISNNFNSLFCVAKTNLPEKRIRNADKYTKAEVNSILDGGLKWRQQLPVQKPIVFTRQSYSYGDPVWLLRNGTISYIDAPSAKINSYCDGRTPIRFMKEDSWQCNVMIQDLEMLQILKNIEETIVVSVTESFKNTTFLNCSSLHCTNWTILICDEESCTHYNKSLHEPTCTDNIVCTDLADKIHYSFHYQGGRIVNATIHMYTKNYSLKVPFIAQHVSVKYHVLEENVTDTSVQFSGNPGYERGLPVIASFSEGNHTDAFFNSTASEHWIPYPNNKEGICKVGYKKNKIVNFGVNIQSKCRFASEAKLPQNATAACEEIQSGITHTLGLHKKGVISPLGNPQGLADDEWIPLHVDISPQVPFYGEYLKEAAELYCSQIVTKYILVFGFADVSDIPDIKKVKILSTKALLTAQNFTFNLEDLTTTLTNEITFIDVTKKPVYEYAGRPHLSINLPKDFFFPFPNNSGYYRYKFNLILLIACSLFVII